MTIKPFEELDFTDDFIFGKVMHNPEICAELLERLLKIKVGRIEYPELQKSIQPYYTTKGVRLDVYVKDSDRVFDIEMQSYKEEAIRKRMRYYQSMVDLDCLMKGADYSELKESFILFICTEDPLKRNLPVYTFREKCEENSDVPLNDNCTKEVYNASCYEKAEDKLVRSFLKYVSKRESDDGFTDRLAELVATVKENETYRQEYMSMNLHDRDKIREGMREGARMNALENAKNLLKMKILNTTQIAQATNLSIEQVMELQKQAAPASAN